MKRVVIAGVAAGVLSTTLRAQAALETAKKLQGDFAVPEAPALTMLSVDPSKLLRPSSMQALTSNLSSSSGTFSFIPTAFAVEFSPAMLIAGDGLRIGDYAAKKNLYRARISVAGARDSITQRSQFAAALRLSLQDKSDLRTNAAFLRAIDRLTYLRVDSAVIVNNALSDAHIPRIESLRTDSQRVRAAAITKDLASQFHDSLGKEVDAQIAAVKRAHEEVQWNADVFDVAAGWKGSSTDSTGRGSRGEGYSVWMTKGWGLGSSGQALIGLRGGSDRDSTDKLRSVGDLVARMYVGGPHAKALIESQASGKASVGPSYLFRAGGEFEAGGALWLSFSAGWESVNGRHGAFTQTVRFHIAPPNL
ncbi:MAG TPA: hypothetical protein VGM82_00495 [Gemmatimonadaceae bacterium]|jgi:hypothetical protein